VSINPRVSHPLPQEERVSGDARSPAAQSNPSVAGEPDPPDPEPRSTGRAVRIVAWVLMALGLCASALGGWTWTNYQQRQSHRDVRNTVSTLTASTSAAFQRDIDFQTSLGQMIASNPDLTNRQLNPWLEGLDLQRRYPGTLGIGFVEVVPSSGLASFAQIIEADPVAGIPSGTFTPLPPGSRPSYCLWRHGIDFTTPMVADLDLCSPTSVFGAPWTIPGILQTVEASGKPMVVDIMSSGKPPISIATGSFGSVIKSAMNSLELISPVYAAKDSTSPSREPQGAFLGWVIGTFNADTLARSAIGPVGGVKLAIGTTSDDQLLKVGSAGKLGAGSHISMTRTTTTSPSLRIRVTASSSNAGVEQGIALGALAALICMLLFLFVKYLSSSREKALRLVAERTEQLHHQAMHDALTGLPNRILLLDRAEQMLARARRHPVAVAALYVDLDNFKDVNDTFGHHVGDRLLENVAVRLHSTIRASDTVGRLGGDEFLILAETDSADINPEFVAERVMSVLEEPFELESPTGSLFFTVSASIGIALGMRTSAEDLIRDADVALYQAKASGKKRYTVFKPEMHTAIRDRIGLGTDLRTALDEGQLFIEYQPIFDLRSMSATGVEALLRWRHPTRGIVPPAEFIPIAEESGLILPIGRFVLAEACGQAASWRSAGYEINVSVNVSALQLEDGSFVEDVRRSLEQTGLGACYLTLEVTESLLMRDVTLTLRVIKELKDLGVRIAIDDFGTGYSSLAYLRQYPIDLLKIDRSFINKSSQSVHGIALVHTLVQLGKALSIETIAEGIEEDSQLTQLQQERCDSGQGFLFARPLAPDQVIEFFRTKTNQDSIAKISS